MTLQPNRRYYLHRRLRPVVKVLPKQHIIELATNVEPALTDKQRYYLSELKKGGYSVQLVIPN